MYILTVPRILNISKILNLQNKKKTFFSSLPKRVFFSIEASEGDRPIDATAVISEWKKNVVVQPIATTIEDLKKNHRLVKDGFYVSHRIFVEKIPEKYTIEPIKTKKTGGYDIETRTSSLILFIS